jgi:hypothetical protein
VAADPLDRLPDPPPAGLGARRLLARMVGARLCFGKAVRQGKYTVIPVAAVRAAGGYGAGGHPGDGGGGGGTLTGRPVGYIEIGPDGARFAPIHSDLRTAAAFALGAGAGAALARAEWLRPLRRAASRSPRRWPGR